MSRRIAWTLVLLWSATAWAQEPSHPDLSGTWTLIRSRSRSISPEAGVTTLRIDQEEHRIKLSTMVAGQGKSETFAFEVRTDGKETVRKRPGHTFFDRASWDGDRLAVTTRIEADWGGGASTATYSLSADRNTLTVEVRSRSRFAYEETSVFRRSDGEPSPAWPRLTLKPLGWGHEEGHYPAGKPIRLQLAITNDQPVPVEIRLRDHGKHGDPEPLWSLSARITDKNGEVLTRSCCPEVDDWWSSAIAISDSCGPGECEMPGDYVTLAPGETVLRTADLASLIWNCPGLVQMHRSSLPAGTYDVQLAVDGVVSPSIKIVVEQGE
jgi:hypothetical protein